MIVLQLAIYCAVFTLMVRFAVRGGAVDGLYSYPKEVQERASRSASPRPKKPPASDAEAPHPLRHLGAGAAVVAGIVVMLF